MLKYQKTGDQPQDKDINKIRVRCLKTNGKEDAAIFAFSVILVIFGQSKIVWCTC